MARLIVAFPRLSSIYWNWGSHQPCSSKKTSLGRRRSRLPKENALDRSSRIKLPSRRSKRLAQTRRPTSFRIRMIRPVVPVCIPRQRRFTAGPAGFHFFPVLQRFLQRGTVRNDFTPPKTSVPFCNCSSLPPDNKGRRTDAENRTGEIADPSRRVFPGGRSTGVHLLAGGIAAAVASAMDHVLPHPATVSRRS